MDETHDLTRMDDEECRRLLGVADVGRLAIVQGNAPAIFPVTYALDGPDIVFRTAPGTKVAHGPGATAAFEVDHVDRATRTGWSVVALGRLEQVTERDADYDRLHELVQPWASGAREVLMRFVPGTLSGRVIG